MVDQETAFRKLDKYRCRWRCRKHRESLGQTRWPRPAWLGRAIAVQANRRADQR